MMMTVSVVPQRSEIPFAESTSSDPFRIAPGTSFSASSGKEKTLDKPTASRSLSDELLADLAESFSIIQNNHAAGNALNRQRMLKTSIRTMLRSLDPHSNYYDPAEFSALMGQHRSEYFGTGLIIANFVENGRNETFVLYTSPGSAAARAGLRYGDKIVSVDNTPVSGFDSYRVREMIRGERGTNVSVTIKRADTLRNETVQLRRERLPQKTVPAAFMVSEDIGYIDLSIGFSYTTVTELDKALSDLKLRGMRSLILDLRGNSGGIVDQAVTVAERFLPAGSEILSQKGRYTTENRAWVSRNQRPEEIPLILLVDGSTASAAEIVVAAFQDNDRSLVVGERTFGKGLVQNVIDLSDGSGIALTAARYFTPSGRSIQRNYSDTGLYDYFNRNVQAGLIADSQEVRLTITKRRVYGGNGITPDIAVGPVKFSEKAGRYIDPAFLFARELANGRVEGGTDQRDLRQKGIFGEDAVTDDMFALFEDFAARQLSQEDAGFDQEEAKLLRHQIRYYLAMALFGGDAAARTLARSDTQVKAAIQNIPMAATLAADARRVSQARSTKKSPPQGFRSGLNN